MVKKTYKKDFLLKAYESMIRIREFEQRAIQCSLKGMTFGNIHPCVYQEAISAGAVMAMEERDFLTASHRGHGQSIAKGTSTKEMMAELFGKATGCCGGKGGSLHVTDVSKGVLGANGIVGGGIPIAAGSALASKIQSKDEVTLAFFGDGAANIGVFHETMNMAATLKLPIVFVCENNKWGASVKNSRVTNTETISVRAKAYDIPGKTIDGNDVLTVYATIKEAIEYARAGNGPSLIECDTYRVLAHNIGDPMTYRTEEEKKEAQHWKEKRDPIVLFRKYLSDNGFKETELDEINKRAVAEIDDAVKFAEESPYPEASMLTADVYTSDNERSVAR